jgi:hypothetical protein
VDACLVSRARFNPTTDFLYLQRVFDGQARPVARCELFDARRDGTKRRGLATPVIYRKFCLVGRDRAGIQLGIEAGWLQHPSARGNRRAPQPRKELTHRKQNRSNGGPPTSSEVDEQPPPEPKSLEPHGFRGSLSGLFDRRLLAGCCPELIDQRQLLRAVPFEQIHRHDLL